MEAEEVRVVGYDHTCLAPGVGQVRFIRGAEQTGLGGGDDRHAALPQRRCNPRVARFIEVESDRSGHDRK